MLYLWELISKMKFNSAELNCSIVFPLYCLIVSKKTDYSLRDFVHFKRWIWWINVNPVSLVHRYVFGTSTGSLFCGFAFCLWSGRNNLHIEVWLLFFMWICKNVCIVVIWIDHIFDCSIRNSDPRLRIILTHRPDSNFNSIFEVFLTGRDFQYKSNSHISLNPSFWLWSWIVSWKSVFTTSHWTKLSKITSVLGHEYCPTSTTRINPASLQILLTLFSGESDSTCWTYCCKMIWSSLGSSSWTGTSALISPRTIDCPTNITGCPVPSWWLSNSSHIVRHCSVDTELIGRNYYAKNCFNCWIICSEVYWQFSMSVALEYTSGQWSRCTENRMSAFCKFQQHFFRDMIPSSLWAVLCRIPLLFRTWSNKWPLPNTKSSRKYLHRFGISQTFIFVAFSVTGDVIEHWHKENSSCESFWCLSQVAR